MGEVESGSDGDLSDAGQAGKYKSILRDLNAREKVWMSREPSHLK